MKINDLKINEKIKANLINLGYENQTPIQEDTLDLILADKNIFALAQTGSGKTAAFLVPLLDKIFYHRDQKVLIVAPTRDLADQIFENAVKIAKFTGIRCAKFVGGIKYAIQEEYLKNDLQVMIATPGRIIDLWKKNLIDLASITYLVLDEADQMLDWGFINDMKFIAEKTCNKKETLLFSATSTSHIKKLVKELMPTYELIEVKDKANIKDLIKQKIYIVTFGNKLKLLLDILGDSSRTMQQCIIFTRTKLEANELTKFLKFKKFDVDCLHSDRSMPSRANILKRFRNHELQILVATNIAARGIDISNLPLVINFDIPEQKETYVHRIGRTGRAGAMGEAITFCGPKQKYEIKELEDLVKAKIEVIEQEKYLAKNPNNPTLDINDSSSQHHYNTKRTNNHKSVAFINKDRSSKAYLFKKN